MQQQMMISDKNSVLAAISEVLRTLDGGIVVSGVQNAGNLAGAFMVLNGVAQFLSGCDIVPPAKKQNELAPTENNAPAEDGLELGE